MTRASTAGDIVTDSPRAVNLSLDQAQASYRRHLRVVLDNLNTRTQMYQQITTVVMVHVDNGHVRRPRIQDGLGLAQVPGSPNQKDAVVQRHPDEVDDRRAIMKHQRAARLCLCWLIGHCHGGSSLRPTLSASGWTCRATRPTRHHQRPMAARARRCTPSRADHSTFGHARNITVTRPGTQEQQIRTVL